LNQHRGQWVALAANSGISYSWLSKFARGCITNPRVGTLSRLTASLDETERATGGAVTRRDLRPHDCEQIWPDLANEKQPAKEAA